MIDAEVASNGVPVESDKKDIGKLGWDQLEACIGFGTNNWFAVDEDAVLRVMCNCRNALRKLKLMPEATRTAFMIVPGFWTKPRIACILSSRE